MKNRLIIIFALFLTLCSFSVIKPPSQVCAVAGGNCCEPAPSDDSIGGEITVSYWEYDPSVQQCRKIVRDQISPGVFSVIPTANLTAKNCTAACNAAGTENLPIAGLNWSVNKYTCAEAPVVIPDIGSAVACCNYSDPTVKYQATVDKCISYTRNPSGQEIPGAEVDPNCAAGAVCAYASLLSDGRPFHICRASSDSTIVCPGGGENSRCINTAIGAIHTDAAGFTKQILGLGIGAGSGIAFLMLIYGSFKMVTSQGNPEGIAQGKEIITSAIVGLVFIILSVTIIQVIGLDILGIGNLGFIGDPTPGSGGGTGGSTF